jgi:hypothetical protein
MGPSNPHSGLRPSEDPMRLGVRARSVKREGFSPPPPLPPARLGGLPEPGAQAPQRARSGTPGAPGARCDEMNIIYMLGRGQGIPHPLHWFSPEASNRKEKSSGVERRFLGLLRSATGALPEPPLWRRGLPVEFPSSPPIPPRGTPASRRRNQAGSSSYPRRPPPRDPGPQGQTKRAG